MVQWLGLGTLTSRVPGSIPGPGAKISPFMIILRIQWRSISSTIGEASEWTRATKKGQGQMAYTKSPSPRCVDYSDWYCSAVSKGKGVDLLGVVLPPNPRACFLEMDLLGSGAVSDSAFTELASHLSVPAPPRPGWQFSSFFGFRALVHTQKLLRTPRSFCLCGLYIMMIPIFTD